ncbi:Ov9 [Ovine gammaherpesvirus 2]|uniref:Ov9 n=1 Tax=Ovine gammaherpesvirus 2 TaxID=10398 RepID=A1BM64_9GAMA|nr:Ov9 [Ovine gammaherpesvirus 2]
MVEAGILSRKVTTGSHWTFFTPQTLKKGACLWKAGAVYFPPASMPPRKAFNDGDLLYFNFTREIHMLLIKSGIPCSYAKGIMRAARTKAVDCSSTFEVIVDGVGHPSPESLERIAKSLFTPRPNWGRVVMFFAYLFYLQISSTQKVFFRDHYKKIESIIEAHIVPWTLSQRKLKEPFPLKMREVVIFFTTVASLVAMLLFCRRAWS